MVLKVILLILSVLFFSVSAFPQTMGEIAGNIVDPASAAVSGAEVTLTPDDGKNSFRARSDENGSFIIRGVPVGVYVITITAPNFITVSEKIEITDAGKKVDFRLSIETVSATVNVETDQNSIELQRVPGSTDLITRRRIKETPATNLKDIFNFTPGILVQPRFGSDEMQISVRGSGLRNNYHSRGINIFINGMPYGDADGFSDFESLEFQVARRVELWKGANALRFGGNSSGGAINIETETGETAFPLEIRLQAGSFGLYKGYISTGGVYGRLGYFIGVSDTELEGYREHGSQGRRRLFGNFTYKIDDETDLRADIIYSNVGERYPGSLNYEDFKNDPRKANPEDLLSDWGRFMNYTRGAFGVTHRIGNKHELSANFSFQYRQLMHPIFNVLDQHVRTFTGEAKYSYVSSRNRFVAGLVPQVSLNGERRFENNLGNHGAMTTHFDGVANNVGFFAENQLDISPKFTLVTGIRIDHSRRNFKDLFLSDGDQSDEKIFNSASPKIGMVWRLTEKGQFFANVSRSYEPPILPELTSYGSTSGFLPLTAQDTWQFEVGMRGKYFRDRFSYDLAVYDSEIKGEILNQNLVPFPGAPFTIPSFRNIPGSRHTGFELFTNILVSDDLFGSHTDVRWTTAYTFANFKFTKDDNFKNNYIPGQPKHLLRSEVRFDHPKGFWFAPNLDWSPKSYYVDSANTALNDSYAVVNFRAGFEKSKYSLFFEAGNLTDKNYSASVVVDDAAGRFYEPANGRSIQIGLSYHFGKR